MKKTSFFSLNLPDKIFGMDQALLKLFLLPLGLILLFIFSLNIIILPKFNEIGITAKNINDVKADTKKIKEQNAYLASIDQEELKKNAEYLDNAVLKDKKSYLLVQIIRNVANNFDYQVQSFSLTPGELKDDGESVKISSSNETVKMPVTLSLIGPQEKNLDLILALEKTLPILFIDKFETKKDGNLSQLNLVVSSYYINNKTNVETKNITLGDLKLSKDESDLISRISSFTKIENNLNGTGSAEFVQYERENPFSF